jgi:peptidoglycan/LPS O-acetylase OafA/YrhL
VSWFIKKPLEAVEVAGNLMSLQGVFVQPLNTNYALWTLSYEVWFYILCGAVAVMVSERRLMLVPALIQPTQPVTAKMDRGHFK